MDVRRTVDLEDLLRANYDRLIDVGACKEQIPAVLAHWNNFRDRADVWFLKKLTKVASHLLKAYPKSLDGHLERLFQLNLEGVQMLRNSPQPTARDAGREMSLPAHLYSHASDVAKVLYEKTGDVHWGTQYYRCRAESAKLSEGYDPVYASFAHSHAGEAAHKLFEQTRDEAWAEHAYRHQLIASRFFARHPENLYYAPRVARFASDAAQACYRLTKKSCWAARSFAAARIAARLYGSGDSANQGRCLEQAGFAAQARGRHGSASSRVRWLHLSYQNFMDAATVPTAEPKTAAHRYRDAARVAQSLAEQTRDPAWNMHHYDCRKSEAAAMQRGGEGYSSFLATCLVDVAKAAEHLYKTGAGLDWAKRAYQDRMDNARVFLPRHPKNAMHSFSFACEDARAVFRETRDVAWGIRAFEAQQESIKLATTLGEHMHVAHAYTHLGKLAEYLFRATSEKVWAENAIAAYATFLDNIPPRYERGRERGIRRSITDLQDALR